MKLPEKYREFQCKIVALAQEYKKTKSPSTKECIDKLLRDVRSFRTQLATAERNMIKSLVFIAIAVVGIVVLTALGLLSKVNLSLSCLGLTR
jgi:hypothetical protein